MCHFRGCLKVVSDNTMWKTGAQRDRLQHVNRRKFSREKHLSGVDLW